MERLWDRDTKNGQRRWALLDHVINTLQKEEQDG